MNKFKLITSSLYSSYRQKKSSKVAFFQVQCFIAGALLGYITGIDFILIKLKSKAADFWDDPFIFATVAILMLIIARKFMPLLEELEKNALTKEEQEQGEFLSWQFILLPIIIMVLISTISV